MPTSNKTKRQTLDAVDDSESNGILHDEEPKNNSGEEGVQGKPIDMFRYLLLRLKHILNLLLVILCI